MKKIITGIMMVLTLLFGVTATAQADVEPMVAGSSIDFYMIQSDIPKTIDLHNTSISGYQYLQSYNTVRNNVYKTCPKSDDFRIMWVGSDDSLHLLSPGDCFYPSQDRVYPVGIFRADYTL